MFGYACCKYEITILLICNMPPILHMLATGAYFRLHFGSWEDKPDRVGQMADISFV